MSVEGYGRLDCGAGRPAGLEPAALRRPARLLPLAAAPGCGPCRGSPDPNRMYGVRIFDITDPRAPKQVAGVQTCRGSHTHSIVTDPKDKDNIYIYVSGTSGIRSADEKAGCVSDPNDPKTSTYGIDVIKVPLAHPEQAAVVSHAYIFVDANTGQIASLRGRRQGTGEPSPNPTTGCHDVTSYPYMSLLGGACSGNGLLLDTSDPVHPKRLDDVADAAFSFWHSATFNNDGTKLLFSDEWGGGTQPMCQSTQPPMWGGDAVYDIQGKGDGRHLHFGGYYKMTGVADGDRKLRRAQRQPRAGARPRHHVAGVLSGRRDRVRFHGLRPTSRKLRTSTADPSTRSASSSAATGRSTTTTGSSTARRLRAASTSSS